MTTQPTKIFDRRRRCPVEAVVHYPLSIERVLDAESAWGPYRLTARRRLHQEGRYQDAPQHSHWDWSRKVGSLSLPGYQCVGIECDEEMQGLMMLATVGYEARLPTSAGKQIVYVDYVESAPWNLEPFVEEPRFGSVGPGLIRAAIQVSIELGYEGRVGLHSLPQSESFYERTCGMTNLGPDAAYQSLIYFEFTPEGVVALSAKGESR